MRNEKYIHFYNKKHLIIIKKEKAYVTKTIIIKIIIESLQIHLKNYRVK